MLDSTFAKYASWVRVNDEATFRAARRWGSVSRWTSSLHCRREIKAALPEHSACARRAQQTVTAKEREQRG